MDVFSNVEVAELGSASRSRLANLAQAGSFAGVFNPSSGGCPPILAGRAMQMGKIQALIDELLSAPRTPRSVHAVTLHGPRGTGKTALLSVMRPALESPSSALGVLAIQGESLQSPESAVSAVISEIEVAPRKTTIKHGSIKAMGMEAGRSVSTVQPDAPPAYGLLTNALKHYAATTGQRPLFIIDEAHSAEAPFLSGVLNAVQSLNASTTPCAAILAGTPDLIAKLDRAGATWYMDRNQNDRLVPVGSVTDADCVLAIQPPLDAMDVRYDLSSLRAAAQWCKGNAYFTQTLGEAALACAFDTPGRFADFAARGPIWTSFQRSANSRYEAAWRSLDNLALTGCARQLGALYRSAGTGRGEGITYAQVEMAIISGLRNPPAHKTPKLDESEALAHFQRLGLVWSPSAHAEGPWEAGLPSFLSFVERRYQKLGHPYYHQTLESLVEDEPLFIFERAPTADEDPSIEP